uniref:ABC-2 type transporter transmembrane domain-containing protein n=1 Tax=Timema bartmani TaxID=61472 RepID=A0A7R9FAV5_9NEOP|nr:unnamed protein product [Timema bartmani]
MITCVGLLISLPYLNLNSDEQTGIQNMQGLLYLIVTETIFTYTYSVFHTFPQEIPLLLREIGNGLYRPGPYYISKMIILIPRAILGPFIYTGLIFYIAGLQGGVTGFLLFCIPVISSAIAATAYGSVMSASFESVSTASLLSVPVDFISVIFSGIFIQLGNLPPHLSWIRYTSTFYFGIEAISILQWQQILHIRCPDEPEIPCISSGIGVLNKYGYSTSNFPIDLTGLFVIYCVCHIIGFLAIWKRSKSQPVY